MIPAEPVRFSTNSTYAFGLGPMFGSSGVASGVVDVDRLALEGAVVQLRKAGIDVLLATGMDSADSSLIRATRGRVGGYNAHIWSIAHRQGAHVLDLWGMRSLRDWRMWVSDRIHLTTEGHAPVAQTALVGLQLPPDAAARDDPLAPPNAGPRIRQLCEDARRGTATRIPGRPDVCAVSRPA